jgi:lipoprotein-releasing system ATP-binding protein
MTILEAKNLKKSFLDPKRLDVLVDVSLTLSAGESIAICGRSGEGKTTLLHILGTLETPDSGKVTIAQNEATPKNAYRLRQRYIGFIFQSFNLLEDFTTLDNVLMPARIARLPIEPDSEAFERAIDNLREVDLLDRAQTPAKLLSGGERQRVAIARALCNDPALILADEPSGNLDHANALRIGQLLMRCVNAKKKSLILVTHDPDLAALCSRRYFLKEGILSVS